MSIKNSNDTIGNKTRKLPACRAVLQTTEFNCFDNNDMKCKKLLNGKKLKFYFA